MTAPEPPLSCLSDETIVERYCMNYGLERTDVTIEQVRFHLSLELRLTQKLLDSEASNRWETFDSSYTELYERLPWLRSTGGSADPTRWSMLLGPPPATVYEVGSGAGALARELGALGYEVVATDISRQRGGDREAAPGVTWAVTDGIHLTQFAQSGSFDAVLSDQVIEHMHPDDVAEHFRSAYALLAPGGRYTFRTPHVLSGPHDVSLIFDYPRAVGMHLKEYTCRDLSEIAMRAGFDLVESVLTVSGVPTVTRSSSLHLRYQMWLEGLPLARRERSRRLLRRAKSPFRPDVWLVAYKG